MKMHRSGILILTKHVSSLCNGDAVKQIVAGIKNIVQSTLYVHVANTSQKISSSTNADHTIASLLAADAAPPSSQSGQITFSKDVFSFISKFYSEAATQCRDLDVNILLHNIGRNYKFHHPLRRQIHCIIADVNPSILQDDSVGEMLQQFVTSRYIEDDMQSVSLPVLPIPNYPFDSVEDDIATSTGIVTSKDTVVIGGTFDHVHTGHKVLLSESTLLADQRLLIGLTDGKMLERKTLYEMIKPWSKRKENLQNFLCDIAAFQIKGDSDVSTSGGPPVLDIVRITDPIGPASTDALLKCIAVSKETEKGGVIVNEARQKNGLDSLHVHLIGGGHLISDDDGIVSPTHEAKFSSSTLRFNALGTLLRCPNNSVQTGAYIIGLTGGIASGKSNVAKHLSNLGAVVIDCDKLGHAAYEPGTETFNKVVKRFGEEIIGVTGTINRKVLAQKVFTPDADGKHSNLQHLNAIVWPEIQRLAQLQITNAVKDRPNPSKPIVCVLDAAVLLEAGWDNFSDEVWVCIIPTSEAIRRVEERDGRSKEEAEKRVQSQMKSTERVANAHMVLSTLWETEVTVNQVKKAWSSLEERLHPGWVYEDYNI